MAQLAMLADKQRTVSPEKVTRQLHLMAQARVSYLSSQTDVLATVNHRLATYQSKMLLIKR